MNPATLAAAKNYSDEIGLNVRRFGAKGDGTTDDSATLQAAFNRGGIIHIPAGTYLVNTSLTVPSNTTIQAAPGAVITIPNNAALTEYPTDWPSNGKLHPVITNADHDNGNENITLRNLVIRGNGDNQPDSFGCAGIYLNNVASASVDNCDVRDFNFGADETKCRAYCVMTLACKGLRILGGHYERAGYECIGIREGCEEVSIIGVHAREGKAHEFQGVRAHEMTITGCTFDSLDADPLAHGGVTWHGGLGITFSNNVVRSRTSCLKPFAGVRRFVAVGNILTSSHGFVVNPHSSDHVRDIDSGDMAFKGNIMRSLGENTGMPVIRIGLGNGDAVDHVVFDGNVIIGENAAASSTSHGVRVTDDSYGITFSNNIFRLAGGTRGLSVDSAHDLRVTGNHIIAEGAGMRFVGGHGYLVLGNKIEGGTHGISLIDGANRAIIKDNDVTYYPTTHDIRTVDAGSEVIVADNLRQA